MAFNFATGQQSYDPFSPYQQSFYNDPRRRGAQGSFNPYALSNFAATQKGGMQSDMQNAPTPPQTKPPASQVPAVPPPGAPSGPASSIYGVNPGTPPPLDYSNPGSAVGTPVPKPGQQGSSGGINYGAYGSVQDVYAQNPGGLPQGWDWAAWSQATGQQDPRYVTASGEPVTFTWNPEGRGFYNPQTGETFDKPGETYPYPPSGPQSAPTSSAPADPFAALRRMGIFSSSPTSSPALSLSSLLGR